LHAYAVRGNHDEAVVKQCLNRQEDPDYVVSNKFKWITELEADDIEYLRELPYTISIPSKKALIVHAGIVPGVPLDEQKLTNLINMRNLDIEDGKYVACERTFRGEAWASLWPGPDHVYFGHNASRRLQQCHNATGLDTGCLYGDSLSGILIDSKKIIQVKAKKTYRQP
jgi:diadenosine tetraphosphatase ApaH/serine/threonine PP2A family protein phosphatase